MTQVVLISELFVREGCADEAVRDLTVCIEAAHREEPGLRRYALHRDVDNPNHFVMVEVFDDLAARMAHRSTSHLALIRTQFGNWLEQEPVRLGTLEPVPLGDPNKGALWTDPRL
jgi:quinol monooxygenase YgiN